MAGVGDLASCDGGFKGQTIRFVTTLSPSDDVWPAAPDDESGAREQEQVPGVTRQRQESREGTRLVIAGSD